MRFLILFRYGIEPVDSDYVCEIYDIPTRISDLVLKKRCEDICQVERFVVSNPDSKMGLKRTCWVIFGDEENFHKFLSSAENLKVL